MIGISLDIVVVSASYLAVFLFGCAIGRVLGRPDHHQRIDVRRFMR